MGSLKRGVSSASKIVVKRRCQTRGMGLYVFYENSVAHCPYQDGESVHAYGQKDVLGFGQVSMRLIAQEIIDSHDDHKNRQYLIGRLPWGGETILQVGDYLAGGFFHPGGIFTFVSLDELAAILPQVLAKFAIDN